jgi:hypothetical protein
MKNPSFIPALAVSFGCLLCASVCGIVLSSCRGETEAESAMQTPARYREMVTIVPAEVEARVTGSGADGVFVDGRTVSIAAFSIAKYETTM